METTKGCAMKDNTLGLYNTADLGEAARRCMESRAQVRRAHCVPSRFIATRSIG